ncbi:metalloprotease TIKI2-like isoform X2 [Dinothrombium tinctorium]|uniref:Metalloprotease TIKI homolog n=1 Tax=Dinothrombium tinctorium TaxID=1965070 RepID=A0A3S3PR03_9ACAR|nr:metalloprotease TIKI2-like isoform X2 [Dinothrombium tinctorium]RWS14760.1 metalloprotease TIKI2-like isoform X2 [Dinothrombium tinctorium]
MMNKFKQEQESNAKLKNDMTKLKETYEQQLAIRKKSNELHLNTPSITPIPYESNQNGESIAQMQAEALERLQALQEQMVGGEKVNDQELKDKLAKKKKIAEKKINAIAKALQQYDDDDQLLIKAYGDITEELRAKTLLLKRAKKKIISLEREVNDLQSEFETERTDYLESIRRQDQQLKLLSQILEKVQPCLRRDCNYANIDKIKAEAVWDEDLQKWRIPDLVITVTKLPPAGGVNPGGRESTRDTSTVFKSVSPNKISPEVRVEEMNENEIIPSGDRLLQKLEKGEQENLAATYFKPRRREQLLNHVHKVKTSKFQSNIHAKPFAAHSKKEKSACSQKHLASFMWKIKRHPNPTSYLFGTIHVPYTLVWDSIPLHIKRAFERSDCVFFELDLLDPYTITALSSCQILPNDKKLIDVLPIDLYRRLKRHLDYVRTMLPKWLTADQRGKGLYAEYLFNAITGNWERKRPVWIMLMVNSLTESDIRSRGIPVLDLYLAQEAQRMNKKTGAVEKVEEQCVPMNDLSNVQVMFALNKTLSQHEKIRLGLMRPSYTTQDLIRHYNCGNLNTVIFNQDTSQVPSLLHSSLEESAKDKESIQRLEEYFRNELVIKRNMKMGKKVIEILDSDMERSYFFAFGAGHFIGRNSIIDVLRAAGFEVERVTEMNINRNARNSSASMTSTKSQKRKACGSYPCSSVALSQMQLRNNHQYLNAQYSSSNDNDGDKYGEDISRVRGDDLPSIDSENNKVNYRNGNQNARTSKNYYNDVSFISASRSTTRATYSTSNTRRSQQHSFRKKFNDLWVRLEAVTEK